MTAINKLFTEALDSVLKKVNFAKLFQFEDFINFSDQSLIFLFEW